MALSTDGGCSFGAAQYPRDLPSPGCQGSTILLADGAVAYSGDDSRSVRARMTVKMAAAPARFPPVFGPGVQLTPQSSGYSALFEAADGRVGALWEGPKGSQGPSEGDPGTILGAHFDHF